MKYLICLLFVAMNAMAAIPSDVMALLKGLPVAHKGECNFREDRSDPIVPCVVLDADEIWFVIIGKTVNGNFYPIEVRAIEKAHPEHQETLWRDPASEV